MHIYRYQYAYDMLKLMVPPLTGMKSSEVRRFILWIGPVSLRWRHALGKMKLLI